MADDTDRRARGLAKFNDVYGGRLPTPPEGAIPFFDVMIEQLFGEVWTRPALDQRDRRLLVMGVLAALGERELYAIQIRSALAAGELTPEQCRETLVHLASYAGYPRMAGLASVIEQIIAEHGAA